MSELVTGEAVALELRPAKLPSRALAVVLDLVVVVAVYIVVTIGLVAATATLDDAAQIAVSIASFLLVLVGGPIAVETLSHGRSLGKLACGLRVVRDDGGPIRFRHALVRGAVGVVEILMTFGIVACIASLVSERGRRLGDVFAGTLVVRERIPVGRMPYVPAPPPWLAGRFAELDLSAVPDELWLAIRQYLTRMRQLDPAVGGAMAERLAMDLAARTGAPAPQGVPAGAYLAAVVHERQTREVRRTFGAAPNGFPSPVPGGYSYPQPGGPAGQPFQPAAPAGHPLHPGAHPGYSVQPGAPAGHSHSPGASAGQPFYPGPGAHSTPPVPAGYAVTPPQPSPAPVTPAAPAAPVERADRDERPSTGFAPPA
ncbi:RDD family protein [Streptomyces sp. NPDC026665]|uniref:RDD family protein n=1 Tax=Streptomyces sp. NPDC026665 TaxID=3154798 RepID=UPI003405755E